MNKNLMPIYKTLFERFGEQQWWPAETEFEVIVGAILTQAASWKNVEIAIKNMGSGDLLTPDAINKISVEKLANVIRPAGYFNSKARKLKEFTNFLFKKYDGDLQVMFNQPIDELRRDLLSIWGIGPETADSIILYAAKKPSFVIDAYTKRIFSRIDLLNGDMDYESIKRLFQDNLPSDMQLYNEFHALIVQLGKDYCRTRPICKECPLLDKCKFH